MPLQAFLSLTQQVRIPLCSRRYQINRMIHEFLQCTHIFSGIFRQILPASAAGNIAFPARQFLDHRFCLLESAVRRERIKQHTVQTVSRNYRNFIKCSEHIQFGQCNILRLLAPDAVTACNSVNGPTRRGLPVAAPNSPPLSRNFSFQASPIAVSATNGPSPTHVEYAFMTPTTLSSAQPGIPAPIGA